MTNQPEAVRPEVGDQADADVRGWADRPVLVVDDSASVRAYHREILADAGFEVCEAGNGYEAHELTLTQPFALLVVDVNMPVMDGYRLVAAVRRESRRPDVPIIMVSTERDAADQAEAYQRGANLYLVKPADPTQLVLTARMLTGRLADGRVTDPRITDPRLADSRVTGPDGGS
jgi:two-component system chemotaxis response regulator CheY